MNTIDAKPHPPINFFAIFFGNIFEHYDKSLYGLLAPFIAVLFFPKADLLTILAIAYFPFGLIFRPLGALFFGVIGDIFGRKKALSVSMLGISVTTALLGLLPTYEQIGTLSPIFLALLRGSIGFFAAGEQTGAPLLLLENIPSKRKELWSSLYESSSVLGTLLAICITLFLVTTGNVERFWRLPFLAGSLLSLCTFFARQKGSEWFLGIKPEKLKPSFAAVKSALPAFFGITFVTGFSCANYEAATLLMNVMLPQMGFSTPVQCLGLHALLILFDMLLLPLFGLLAVRIGKERLMLSALFLAMGSLFPLFYALSKGSLLALITTRSLLILFGVAFAAPYQLWVSEASAPNYRYTLVSLGKAFGAQAIGAPILSLALFGYGQSASKTIIYLVPAYLFGSAFFASLSILYFWKRNRNKRSDPQADACSV